MIKLLKAVAFRLKKDIMFWLFVFLTIGICGFTLFRYSSIDEITLDKVLNEFIMYIGFFIAIFVSIFIGKEHSQGILINKIVVGHSRISIFLSNLFISILVSLLCELIYFLIVSLVGKHLFENVKIQSIQLVMIILNTVLIIISFCSIFNFITMICSEITISTTICIIIFIVMYIIQGVFSLNAHSPKYIEHILYDENGNKHIISQELNPNYPGDQKVKKAKIMYLAIPQGQAMEISNSNLELLQQMPLYSIPLTVIINILGIYIFSKKELK